MFEIEYQSECIFIISSSNNELKVVLLDDINLKIETINTYFTGIENDMIEKAIKKVLNNGDYDISYEIEQYRKSKLYQSIKEYNQE